MLTDRRRRWLFRAGQVAALSVMALFTLIDIYFALTRTSVIYEYNAVGVALAQTLVVPVIAAVWLPTYQRETRVLPSLVLALSAMSLLVTYTVWILLRGHRIEMTSFGEMVGMILILFVVTRKGSLQLTIPAIGMGLLALIAQPFRLINESDALLFGLLQVIVASAMIGAGGYLRHLDGTKEWQLATTRAEQRAEFARDLHDYIAHHVTGIVVQAQGARLIAGRDPERAAQALEQIERAGAEAMTAMRGMVGMLRGGKADAPVTPLKDITDLPPLIESFSDAGGPRAHLHVDGSLEELPVGVTTSAHRVVMEALTNVRQHADQATHVSVSIRRTPDWLLVRVADNGTPPRPPISHSRAGFGLAGLAERVEATGGWLRAGPGIDRGWIVDAGFPLGKGTSRKVRG